MNLTHYRLPLKLAYRLVRYAHYDMNNGFVEVSS